MSFTNGVYTPPSGAENAFPGQVIASATWNAIFTDIANNGLTVVGTSGANTIKGNNTNATATVADLTVPQAQSMLGMSIFTVKLTGVNFNAANTDNPISITLPSGFTRYSVASCVLSGASGSLSTATCAMYTNASAGGVVVFGSTAITVTSSAENTINNTQIITPSALITESFNVATLYFRTLTAEGIAQTGNVTLYIRPI
jgi:hypothetical protein